MHSLKCMRTRLDLDFTSHPAVFRHLVVACAPLSLTEYSKNTKLHILRRMDIMELLTIWKINGIFSNEHFKDIL